MLAPAAHAPAAVAPANPPSTAANPSPCVAPALEKSRILPVPIPPTNEPIWYPRAALSLKEPRWLYLFGWLYLFVLVARSVRLGGSICSSWWLDLFVFARFVLQPLSRWVARFVARFVHPRAAKLRFPCNVRGHSCLPDCRRRRRPSRLRRTRRFLNPPILAPASDHRADTAGGP